jgi:hypothetical protein
MQNGLSIVSAVACGLVLRGNVISMGSPRESNELVSVRVRGALD